MSLLMDIALYLDYNSIGVASGNDMNIFCDTMQDLPNDAISINEIAGVPSFTCEVIQRSIKFLFRAVKYSDCKNMADDVFRLFENYKERIIWLSNDRWTISKARNYPYKIGVDEKDRVLFVLNLGITTYRD